MKKRQQIKNKKRNKTKKKVNRIRKVNCSPNTKKNKFSCYSNESLYILKKYWNKKHPDLQIESNDSREIWNSLKHYLNNVCNKESCWLRQKFIKNNLNSELKSYTFAPNAPSVWKKNPNEWLDSLDITRIMKQYEHFHKDFVFIGPSPIDFDKRKEYGECVWEELCKFNLRNEISKGKKKIGIIFNLDPHWKDGSHWVSLFIDVKREFIFYFDSTGDKEPKEVKKFIDRVKKQSQGLFDFKNIYINSKSHQKEDSECGMYSLFFIISMIKNKDPNYFLNNSIPDDNMEQLRSKYFNI